MSSIKQGKAAQLTFLRAYKCWPLHAVHLFSFAFFKNFNLVFGFTCLSLDLCFLKSIKSISIVSINFILN